MTFPGLPTTTAKSGISLMITAPAPIVTHFPILIPGIIVAPAPTWLPSPISTLPVTVAEGET